MARITYGEALQSLSTRNDALALFYREGARSLLSRSMSNLAASIIDQRRELAKELASLAREEALAALPLEIEGTLPQPPSPAPSPDSRVESFLEGMLKMETEDYDSLSALAGAVLPRSVEAAERLAALAEQARKRASWAQDHLELLGIS